VSDIAADRRILVHKLSLSGEVMATYAALVAERMPSGVRLEAAWTRPSLALGYVTFETGDRFVEWYYADRWYNILEISSPDGTLKGWYCNIAEPAAIAAHAIRYRDLLLDLWVHPDGEMLPLDEDEFAAEQALTAEQRSRALAALAELQRLVRDRLPPFDELPPLLPSA
jgi:predicted RNA-binding protein associated with RNAse of E/G family